MKTIISRYKGKCDFCGKVVKKGSVVHWDPQNKSIFHPECYRAKLLNSPQENVQVQDPGELAEDRWNEIYGD